VSTEIIELDDGLNYTHLSPSICVALAAGLVHMDDVPEKYGLTEAQWTKLKQSKFFIGMLKDAGEKFTGEVGASRRITLKSEMLLEDALPILDEMVHNREGSSQSKLDSIKQLSVLAGRTQRAAEGGAAGAGFNVAIHINTGENTKSAPIVVIPANDGEAE
jgi:hypothetical protein